MELLENGVATHFGVTPFFSIIAMSQASSQGQGYIDADAWCKRALRPLPRYNGLLTDAESSDVNSTVWEC